MIGIRPLISPLTRAKMNGIIRNNTICIFARALNGIQANHHQGSHQNLNGIIPLNDLHKYILPIIVDSPTKALMSTLSPVFIRSPLNRLRICYSSVRVKPLKNTRHVKLERSYEWRADVRTVDVPKNPQSISRDNQSFHENLAAGLI